MIRHINIFISMNYFQSVEIVVRELSSRWDFLLFWFSFKFHWIFQHCKFDNHTEVRKKFKTILLKRNNFGAFLWVRSCDMAERKEKNDSKFEMNSREDFFCCCMYSFSQSVYSRNCTTVAIINRKRKGIMKHLFILLFKGMAEEKKEKCRNCQFLLVRIFFVLCSFCEKKCFVSSFV